MEPMMINESQGSGRAGGAACSLPSAERLLRLAEFDDLFRSSLRSVDKTSDTCARLLLAGDADLTERTRRLADAEASCCSFFTFGVTAVEPGLVALDVEVPPAYTDMLARLVGLAEAALGNPMTTASPRLRRGEVASAAGVNIETLRYYERRGLLAPERSPGGHRLYSPEAVTTLRVIKAAQRLGFTLGEVAELLELGRHRHAKRGDTGLQQRAREKLVEVEERIADLVTIRDSLNMALDAGCDDLLACASEERCPIPFEAISLRPGK